jgi:hypothetical protein
MSAFTAVHTDQIRAMLAEKGYEVSEPSANVLAIRDVSSGVTIHAVLEGAILFLSLICVRAPESAVTPEIMRKMLDADNGISTSNFQLYRAGDGTVAVTLNNFCTLQDMGAEDQDDILSCVHFLLADVLEARRLIGGLSQAAR